MSIDSIFMNPISQLLGYKKNEQQTSKLDYPFSVRIFDPYRFNPGCDCPRGRLLRGVAIH